MILDFLSYVLGKIIFFTGAIVSASFPKPLSKEEESLCIKKMREGDLLAKEKLIDHNLRLVSHIAKKYSGVAETDDLISVGSIGLIKAINTYTEGKGSTLATYTARCIENEILMLIRSNKKYKNDLHLSDKIGADKDGNELTLMDLLYEKEDVVFEKVDKGIERASLLKYMKEVLTEREYTIMCLRYGIKSDRSYCQREVAKMLKISRSYVSRIEKKAIEKLKEGASNKDFYC